MGEKYVLPRESIIALKKHRGLYSVGLHIVHSVPLYPQFIVFWVSVFRKRASFALLKRRLESLDYEVIGSSWFGGETVLAQWFKSN